MGTKRHPYVQTLADKIVEAFPKFIAEQVPKFELKQDWYEHAGKLFLEFPRLPPFKLKEQEFERLLAKWRITQSERDLHLIRQQVHLSNLLHEEMWLKR